MRTIAVTIKSGHQAAAVESEEPPVTAGVKPEVYRYRTAGADDGRAFQVPKFKPAVKVKNNACVGVARAGRAQVKGGA